MTDVLTSARGRIALNAYGIAAAIFIAAPIFVLVPLAFSGDNSFLLPPKTLTLSWFGNLVTQPRWGNAAWLSIVVGLLSAAIATIGGTLAAIGIAHLPQRAQRLVKLVFIAPMIVPLMVIAVGFYVTFSQLRLVGQFITLPLAHAILGLPFVVLPVLSRLALMDPSLERAGASLGAGQGRILFRVIVPQLYSAMAAGFALAFIISFDEVIVAQFLTGPRLETLPRRMWEGLAQSGLDNTLTAIATVQLGLALLVFLAYEVLRRQHRRATAISPIVGPATAGAAPPVAAGNPISAARGVPIILDHLTKRYGTSAAVDDVSFEVGAGEFVTILGPSGSGKTTLLMMIAGFVAADEGRLFIGADDVSGVPPHRRDIGMVFQNYALFPHMSVLDNVLFPLKVRGNRDAGQMRALAYAALELVRLEGFADRRIHQLSGGQQQRVAFARATVFGPRALLMDEPLAALDRSLRLELQAEIRGLQRSVGQTTIYVTHDQEEALNLSDRIAIMRDGRLQQIGTPAEVYFAPRTPFVAGFFGEANMLTGSVRSGQFHADGFESPVACASLADGAAVGCVRPDRVSIVPAGEGRISGQVREARFSGPVMRVQLETPAGPIKVTQPMSAGHMARMPVPGETLSLSFDVADCHVMADLS